MPHETKQFPHRHFLQSPAKIYLAARMNLEDRIHTHQAQHCKKKI